MHLNLAYRWFCRLGFEGDVPEHSTFSKNRHGRFRESDLSRELFKTTVRRCIAERLDDGEIFAVGAGPIRADANKQRCPALRSSGAMDLSPEGPCQVSARSRPDATISLRALQSTCSCGWRPSASPKKSSLPKTSAHRRRDRQLRRQLPGHRQERRSGAARPRARPRHASARSGERCGIRWSKERVHIVPR